MSIDILVVDEDAGVRANLVAQLRSLPDVLDVLVAEKDNLPEAINLVDHFELIVIAANMPGCLRLEPQLCQLAPRKVIGVSSLPTCRQAMLRNGCIAVTDSFDLARTILNVIETSRIPV